MLILEIMSGRVHTMGVSQSASYVMNQYIMYTNLGTGKEPHSLHIVTVH